MRRIHLIVTVAILTSLMLTACVTTTTPTTGETGEAFTYTDEWGVGVVPAGNPIKIGFAAALSGAGLDVLGIDEKRGAEIALRDKGPILGFEVELDAQDDLCSAEGGQTVANKFVADPQVVAVIGNMCSSSCVPASVIYQQNHYTMVSPSCTAPSLTAPETATEIFHRTATDDTNQGPMDAQFIYEVLGLRKIATIHDGSPYGEQLANQVADTFESLGGTVIARQAISVGETDMKSVLRTIKAAEGGPPELIFFGGFVAEGAQLARQRAEVEGMENVLFFGPDGIYAKAFIEAAGAMAEGVYASGPAPVPDEFVQKYVEAYGEEPIAPYHGTAYDAFMLIANGIEAVGKVDPQGNLHIGRKALRDYIRSNKGYQGLSGTITCNEYGNCGPKDLVIAVIEGGKFKVVYKSVE